MAKIIFYLLILVHCFVIFSKESEVKYESMVEDFGPFAEERFERHIHEIVRRAVIPTNSSTQFSKPATTSGRQLQNTTSGSSVTPTDSSKMTTTSALNVTITEDNHKYYTSRYYHSGRKWWFNLDDGGTPKLHAKLSKNLQYSDTLKISFKFPYYGHLIDQITVTNKGFLFLGGKLHVFHALMQYVAPLMADFAPHLHQDTAIRYVDTGHRFTVEWNSIRLTEQKAVFVFAQEQLLRVKCSNCLAKISAILAFVVDGEFSFQCSLFKNGTIVFAYKKIPIPVSEIKNDTFFVQVGVSDGFKIVRRIRGLFIIKRKLHTSITVNIYVRYHKVKLSKNDVKSGSAFILTPLPNCVSFKNCHSCAKSNTTFTCAWCPTLKRCSDGIDRYRQEWIVSRCFKNSVTKCSGDESRKTSSRLSPGIIIAIVLCLVIILAIILWVVYAYRRPQSSSGMFLIQYGNPRKWFQRSSVESETSGGKVSFKTMSNESNA